MARSLAAILSVPGDCLLGHRARDGHGTVYVPCQLESSIFHFPLVPLRNVYVVFFSYCRISKGCVYAFETTKNVKSLLGRRCMWWLHSSQSVRPAQLWLWLRDEQIVHTDKLSVQICCLGQSGNLRLCQKFRNSKTQTTNKSTNNI